LISLPVHLAGYRERGVLRRFHASSVPAWAVFASQAWVGFIVAVLGSLLLVAVGVGMYDMAQPVSLTGVLFAFVLGTVAFLAVGFVLGALLPTARSALGLGLILFFLNMFLSGADGPRAVLPKAMRDAGEALPLTHVVIALQDPWLGFGWNALQLGILAGIVVVAALLSVRLFRWE
jgi:ABC-2 type transport system permease protein